MSAPTQRKSRDIVIIGGGHNGLVTAFYLAKAGYKPLVLERNAQVGGAAVTDEFHPGFRCSTLAHTAGPIQPQIVRDMQLEKHGLRWITPEICVTALSPDGRALSLYQDATKSHAGDRCVLAERCGEVFRISSNRSGKSAKSLAKRWPPRRPISTTPAAAICGACCRPGARSANSVRETCFACCAGGRWRWPIWPRNTSKPNCCGR